MKVTIKDVAQLAHVSPATVSRVLTDSNLVNHSTKEKVLSAIQTLNYKYERQEKNYPSSSSSKNTILVITGDVSSGFFSRFYHTLQEELSKNNYIPLIAYSEYKESIDENYFLYAQHQQFAGIVLVTPSETPHMMELLANRKLPTVLVNRPICSVDLDVVCLDHYRAGYLAAQKLLTNGHRRIACLLNSRKSSADAEKMLGFQTAFQDAGLDFSNISIFYGNYSTEDAYAACMKNRETLNLCSAVFIVNDQMTRGFLKARRQWKKQIPEDISLISIASSQIYDYDLPITTIIQNAGAIGESAARQMLLLLEKPDSIPQKIYFPPIFCEGNSISNLS